MVDLIVFGELVAALTFMGLLSQGVATSYTFAVCTVLVYRGVIVTNP